MPISYDYNCLRSFSSGEVDFHKQESNVYGGRTVDKLVQSQQSVIIQNYWTDVLHYLIHFHTHLPLDFL